MILYTCRLCFSPPKPAVKVSDNSNTLRDTELLLHPKPASGGQPPEYIKVLKPNNCDVPSDCILPSHNHVYEDKPTHTEETAADLERTEGEPDGELFALATSLIYWILFSLLSPNSSPD